MVVSPSSFPAQILPIDFEEALRAATQRVLSAPTPRALAESIRYSLLAPGKRIRPRLTLACGRMLDLSREAILPPAIAIEMIHCFTLIHDDLPCLDNDDLRRGQPSNHKKFGEATALLAGDSLVAMAFEQLTAAAPHVGAPELIAALRRLAEALGPQGLCGGQSAELELGEKATRRDVEAVHRAKTGALFSAALLIPRDFAGVSPESTPGMALDLFARELGCAFQVADDLEDAPQPGDEASERGSILRFQSRSEAARDAIRRVRAGGDALSACWKRGADPLLHLATELTSRIERLAATTD